MAVRTALVRLSGERGNYQASLELDWTGAARPRENLPMVEFADAPPAPEDFADLQTFLLSTEAASPHFNTVGRALHDLIITGDIAAELSRARAAGSVRMLLDVIPEELKTVPWELMHGNNGHVFTNTSHPAARVASTFNPDLSAPGMCWPLRVLLVVGTRDGRIRVDEEIDHVRDAFRKVCGFVDLEVMRCPSREDVRTRCASMRPHVFHFLGHADFNDDIGGYLILEKPKTGAIEWMPSNIRDDLQSWPPRLAVLNACYTGQPSEDRGTRAAAEGLVYLQVPAVIAMQGPIRGSAAERFAKGLYEALGTGESLDVAVARARVAITDVANENQREYALPCLHLGAPPELILNCPPAVIDRVGRSHVREMTYFVDRGSKRRRLWELVRSDFHTAPKIFAVTGPTRVGKGALVRWCLGMAAVWNDPIAHIDFSHDGQIDSATFLDGIAQALPPSINAAVPGQIDAFLAELSDYRANQSRAKAAGRAYDTSPSVLYASFRKLLIRATAATNTTPLIIGVEGLDGLEHGEWVSAAIPELIQPIDRGEAGSVRLMVALQENELIRWFPQQIFSPAAIAEINLGLFPPEMFVELTSQRLRSRDYARRSFEEVITSKPQLEPWNTEYFDLLDLRAKVERWEREE